MHAFWVGKEVEGPHKGLLTLFIKGWFDTWEMLQDALERTGAKAIYFGAGRDPEINFNLVRQAVEAGINPVTVELRCPQVLPPCAEICKKIEIVYVFDRAFHGVGVERVKLEDTRGHKLKMFYAGDMLSDVDFSKSLVQGDKRLFGDPEG